MAAEDLPADEAPAAAALQPGTDVEASTDGGGMDVEDGARSTRQMLESNPPPPPLPAGWFLKPSLSSPGNYYYFNQDTGSCQWEYPTAAAVVDGQTAASGAAGDAAVSQESLNATAAAAAAAVKSILKRSNSGAEGEEGAATEPSPSPPSRKRAKTGEKERTSSSGRKEKERPPSSKEKRHHHDRAGEPREVRVLHILKKHRDSRRPASWRNPKIDDTKEKATSDLRELMAILDQSKGNPKELRATFEELAKTESDCSSAKRGGDLGFFGRKKMQPAFEKASFGLKVGELSDVVDTSSGVHVILRLA